MPASVEPNSSPLPEIQIPLPKVALFLRQLIHDLRNHLNAAELQSAYLAEIVESPEAKEEISRLRTAISEVGADLQKVTGALSEPRLTTMPYAAADFLADLQQRVATDHPNDHGKVQWTSDVGGAHLPIDPQALLAALSELFANAFRHHPGPGGISVQAGIDSGRLILRLLEPKESFGGSTTNWGREPFGAIGKGHYGLGLHRSRVIIEAHGGQLTARYDPPASSLITTVVLPLAE